MNNILIIGHGVSVLTSERGKEIDFFPGAIVRLNQYQIKGYEKHIGTRTDIYSSGGPFTLENAKKDYILTLVYMTSPCNDYYDRFVKANENNRLFTFSKKEITDLRLELKNGEACYPTTGMMTIYSFLQRGFNVYIYGFDFYKGGGPHYFNQMQEYEMAKGHEPFKEEVYVNMLINQDKVKYF